MELTCLLDTCSKVNKAVDYRRCCSCDFYGGESSMGTVKCKHPFVEKTDAQIREARRQAFKQSGVAMTSFLTGPIRHS